MEFGKSCVVGMILGVEDERLRDRGPSLSLRLEEDRACPITGRTLDHGYDIRILPFAIERGNRNQSFDGRDVPAADRKQPFGASERRIGRVHCHRRSPVSRDGAVSITSAAFSSLARSLP
ncbi:MAG TPA: hypothetical protein VGN68_13960 [Sphingopyxis sp.]|uniref:hypothetical protein n=1 Tax=Sphingopyxis TaxID=165697 RepID=UPI0019317190|nr:MULTISPECIES: hypothetical protein [Sphingopyxis]HEV7342734.1 hypothetical protein [Sphingopyxis sp.]